MYRQLVINISEPETRVALLEDGTIAELFVDRKDLYDISGNIYKGRVQRVLPGMQAAFVDIGLKQAAFIYVNDVLHDPLLEFLPLFGEDVEDEGEDASQGPVPEHRQLRPIEELITEGQLAVAWEAHPEDIAPFIHAHPTQSEALGEAFLALAGKPLHAL